MTDVVLISHGSPSAPNGADDALKTLAGQVQTLLPGFRLRAATLAKPNALATACAGMSQPLIYPVFMSQGWFTQHELVRRLAGIGQQGRVLPPLGVEPDLPDMIIKSLEDFMNSHAMDPKETDLLVAAHGSARPGRATETTFAMVDIFRQRIPFSRVLPAFIEEAPFISDVARGLNGLCLPFFAQTSGHVRDDLPAALRQAGFMGPVLPPVGEDPGIPELIAKSLLRQIGNIASVI